MFNDLNRLQSNLFRKNTNFYFLQLRQKLLLVFLLLSLPCCASQKNTSFYGNNQKFYQVVDSYFQEKIRKNLAKTKSKPCISNMQTILVKNTTWQITNIDCNQTRCVVNVKIKEPELGVWIKPLMNQALLEAIKKGGMKNVSERTCVILAQKIVSSNYHPPTFKIIRRKLYLKKARGRWYVTSEEKTLN